MSTAAKFSLPSSFDTDPYYSELKERIILSTGMTYYNERDSELYSKLKQRMEILHLKTCKEYLFYLEKDIRGSTELDSLICELTIGETYFFRGPDQFETLKNEIIPELIRKNSGRKQLRIWSAGCSTGAEPYSLAILLEEYFRNQLMGWDVTILGSDINRQFLARATEGLYDSWAFRTSEFDFRNKYFRQAGKNWKISKEIASKVQFQYHNLLKHPYPSLINNLEALDLILCRNVMIYFDQATFMKIIRHFEESLTQEGWLILSHAEQRLTLGSFESIQKNNSFFYRKKSTRIPKVTQPPFIHQASQIELPRSTPPQSNELDISFIRNSADRGEFSSAVVYCERFLATHQMSSTGHFYFGLVLEHVGRSQEAIEHLLRSYELDPESTLSCYYLGLIFQSRKNIAEAVKWYEKARSILTHIQEDVLFSDADGINARELGLLISANLDILSLSASSENGKE